MGWKAPQYQEMYDMFWGEPVHSIILPTGIFPQNEDGFPVLTKKTQKFVMQMMRSQVAIVIRPTKPNEEIRDHL